MSVERLQKTSCANALPFLIVVLISAIGLVLALQGWNSRNLNVDLLPYIDDAHKFVMLWQIPEKGTLTSFASFTPPGITWLMIPGVYWFRDPRLAESIGCAILYVGTLLGIFFLVRDHLGALCAYSAVVLWSVSELGLYFAETTGARSHPFFFVWMTYAAGKWIDRDNHWYLVASLIIWAAGMYVFLEIAPAIFMIPTLWLLYRPTVRIWAMMLGIGFIGLLWYPYLQFEQARRFVDIKSQVLRENILPRNFKASWCNPNLAPQSWQAHFGVRDTDSNVGSNSQREFLASLHFVTYRAKLVLTTLLLANFNHAAQVPYANVMLLALTIAGLILLLVEAFKRKLVRIWCPGLQSRLIMIWSGIAALLLAVVVNEVVIASFLSLDGSLEPTTRWTIRLVQAVLVISGISLFIARNIRSIPGCLVQIFSRLISDGERQSRKAGVIAVGLIIPWLILLLLTEPYRLERFWWMWPLQIVSLAAVVTYFLPRLQLSRVYIGLGCLIILLLVASNSKVISRASVWSMDGWSGHESELSKVSEYIAQQSDEKKPAQLIIGYVFATQPFVSVFHVVDHRYKVGGDFDALLKHRHDIVNVNGCAEGVSPQDQYRVIQIRPGTHHNYWQEKIDVPADDSFYLVREFETFGVFKKIGHQL